MRVPRLLKSTWSPLGSGIAGAVYALAANSSDLYAGGAFTSAGGIVASNVARWNGSTWSALGSGVNSNVGAVSILANRLYVGGLFTAAGNVPALRVARFDGANWSALGSGMNDQVSEIVTDGSSLIMGGLFTQADSLTVNHVARYDGTNWSTLGNAGRDQGSPFFTRSVHAVSNRVYLGGLFTGVGGARASRIAYWDGTNWSPMGSGVRGTNEGNGTAVNAVLAVGTNVYVGGVFTNAGGVAANNIARWNGNSWSALGSGVNGSVAAIGAVGNSVYVGGNFTAAGGVTAFNIARWDGANWSSLPPPFAGTINNFFVSALAVIGNDLYIGGSFSAGDGASNIVRFSNNQWFQLTGNVNDRVSSLAVIGSDVYVGGRFTSAGALAVNRIAKWNGSSWSALGAGVSGSGTPTVTALAAIGTNLYAGGSFTNIGGVAVSRVAKWDGASWSAMGSGLLMQPGSATVAGLAARGNDLYVAGTLSGAGGKASSFFAHWNEQTDFDLRPTLQFSQPARLPGGEFQMRLTALGVPVYVIEATTNFVSWTPLITNSATPFIFTDSNAVGRPQRFYRSRTP
jgi:trimeric autotransporter adhesin